MIQRNWAKQSCYWRKFQLKINPQHWSIEAPLSLLKLSIFITLLPDAVNAERAVIWLYGTGQSGVPRINLNFRQLPEMRVQTVLQSIKFPQWVKKATACLSQITEVNLHFSRCSRQMSLVAPSKYSSLRRLKWIPSSGLDNNVFGLSYYRYYKNRIWQFALFQAYRPQKISLL